MFSPTYLDDAIQLVITVARDHDGDSEDRYILVVLLWSSYGIGQTIIFSSCSLFFPSFFLA